MEYEHTSNCSTLSKSISNSLNGSEVEKSEGKLQNLSNYLEC